MVARSWRVLFSLEQVLVLILACLHPNPYALTPATQPLHPNPYTLAPVP
jgi:hypothetical protein